MNAVHIVSQSPHPSSVQPQVWITDSGATNHMTADLSNLSLNTAYSTNDMVQTANDEGLLVSHIGSTIIATPSKHIKLNSILCFLN